MGDASFDRLVAMLDYTKFVVTTQADGEMSGCLVGFATQTSMHPSRFLAGISRANHTYGVAARSDYWRCMSWSAAISAWRVCSVAKPVTRSTNSTHCWWHSGPHGMPILDDAVAWFVGTTLNRDDMLSRCGRSDTGPQRLRR